ncbi:MAG: 2-oxoglutarate dehydrogenase complex dihydrolipoyllysine-residue succinyltransferase [Candidatus Promineifilaceae bacterium]
MAAKVLVPELGESIVEATVGRWQKQVGDPVAVGDILVSLETDKVDIDVGADKGGVLASIAAQEGEDVQIGDLLATIEEKEGVPAGAPDGAKGAAQAAAPAEAEALAERPKESAAQPAEAATDSEVEPSAEPATGDGRAQAEPADKATPVARRLAEERGLDVAQIQGSGPGGRVTRQDVERFARQPASEIRPSETGAIRGQTRQRMSRRRRTIGARLVEAQRTAAMLTTFNEADMGAVMDIRRRRQEGFQERHGVKLGFMSFFVKAAVGALRAFPQVNAEIEGDEIVFKHFYDIGMAIGAEEGLVVPVLRDADRMSFGEIELVIQAYVDKVKEGTLALEDLRGGTFTITNGGVFGSLLSTPILNPPQVGILGLHKIEERPIARDGQVVIRPMMYLALSYDHRLVDGREAVQFLVRIKELIEEPDRLLLEN